MCHRWMMWTGLVRLHVFCNGAAVSQAQSKNVYLDSISRAALSWWSVSVIPLWKAWQLIVDTFGQSAPPYLGPGMRFFFDRLAALDALTKAQLGTLLDETWGEVVNVNNFTKDELVMKVLAYEGIWVDLAYGTV